MQNKWENYAHFVFKDQKHRIKFEIHRQIFVFYSSVQRIKFHKPLRILTNWRIRCVCHVMYNS